MRLDERILELGSVLFTLHARGKVLCLHVSSSLTAQRYRSDGRAAYHNQRQPQK